MIGSHTTDSSQVVMSQVINTFPLVKELDLPTCLGLSLQERLTCDKAAFHPNRCNQKDRFVNSKALISLLGSASHSKMVSFEIYYFQIVAGRIARLFPHLTSKKTSGEADG